MTLDFEGYGLQLDPTTRIGLFVSLWLVIVLLSMITSMAYCCSLQMKFIVSRPNLATTGRAYNATEVDRNLDRSTSLIELLNKLFTIHPYPEPEKKKKKRRSKRKYEMKNGWRRKLKAKNRQWERENQDQHSNHLKHRNYSIQTRDHKENYHCNTETKQAEENLSRNQLEMTVSDMHKPSSNETLGRPPLLKEDNPTLHCTSKTLPPKACECHAQHFHTSQLSELHTEQFVLQLPIQAMDNQIDEFCNIMIC